MKLFKVPVVYLTIFSIVIFVISFMYNLSAEVPFELIFTSTTPLLIFTLAIIGIAFLFFGYGTPFMALFAGLYTGLIYSVNFWQAISTIIISFLVGYASIRMGTVLLHDLQGKENFKTVWNNLSFFIAIAIVFSIIFGF